MRTSDLDELRDVVEKVRAEEFPDLDATFLNAVIDAEEGSPEEDEEALRAINAALDAALAREGGA